jgi:mono/diheme cytochrome c family protein
VRPVLAAAAVVAPAVFAVGLALGGARAENAASAAGASLAAFDQMASVMTSPRCMNCHTVTGFPRQGDDRHPHLFGVSRGADGMGAAGLRCAVCHGRANNPASGVPGADEDWRLAPLSMGWEGLSKAEICQHVRDPSRNGGRSGAAVVNHLRTHLVIWAWAPGDDLHGRPRTIPPLSYDAFMHAAKTWAQTGEACPRPSA